MQAAFRDLCILHKSPLPSFRDLYILQKSPLPSFRDLYILQESPLPSFRDLYLLQGAPQQKVQSAISPLRTLLPLRERLDVGHRGTG